MLSIQHWKTSTQTPVYYVRTPTLPILELRVVFDAGSCRDGEQPGIAELAHNLICEGTQKNSAEAVAKSFENIGAVFNTLVNHDMAVVSLRTLTLEHFLNPAVKALTSILKEPLFSEHGVDHQRKLLLAFLAQEEQSPLELTENAFYKTIYSKHPYCNPISGNKKSVRQLTAEQIAAFYFQHYVAQNASIVIVGDLTQQRAKQLAEKIVRSLPQGKRSKPLTNAAKTTRYGIKKIPYTYDTSQCHVLMGQVGINFSDPHFFPLYVGNYILGGDPLISRLGQSVREKQGLVYDVRSYFLRLRYTGPFTISFQTSLKKTQKALDTVYKTLEKFMSKPPGQLELRAVQDHITKGYALNFDSNRAIASNLMMLAFYQLPLNYFDLFCEKVTAVTADHIYESFNDKIDIDRLNVICLGGKS